MKVTGVILAGGKSRRMGQNKSLLKIGDKTIIEIIVDKILPIFDEVIVVTNSMEDYTMLKGVKLIPDIIQTKEANSLIGLYSGILEAENEYSFVIPCDMPFIDTTLIQYMIDNISDNDIVVPKLNGFYESLHSIYKKTTIEILKSMLDNNNYRINRLFEDYPELSIKKIHKDTLDELGVSEDCFLNLNTLEEYKQAIELFK